MIRILNRLKKCKILNPEKVCVKSGGSNDDEDPHCINGNWNGHTCECYPGFVLSNDDHHGHWNGQNVCVKSNNVGPITECSLSCNYGQCNIDGFGDQFCACSSGYTGMVEKHAAAIFRRYLKF